MAKLRTFSFGGGVQSMAVLVMQSQGIVQFDHFLFANVGEDSENPTTLEYYRNVAVPFAQQHGISLIEVSHPSETLYERIFRTKRSVPIPARMSNGAPGNRVCTSDFKILVIARWLKKHGATATEPAITGLGISIDEWHRARSASWIAWQVLEYPLIDMRMSRQHCIRAIADAGLPIPPKSSCYFCPFHSPTEWLRIKRETPDLFAKAVEIEEHINQKRVNEKLGHGNKVWLHPSLRPLSVAVGDQLSLFDEMSVCESGYCMV